MYQNNSSAISELLKKEFKTKRSQDKEIHLILRLCFPEIFRLSLVNFKTLSRYVHFGL